MLSYTRTLDQEIAPPVTFALDATPLSVPTGGVARYTLELARALAFRFPEDFYWLLSDQHIPPLPGLPANLNIGGNPRNPLSRKWWMFGLQQEMSRRGADLFHGTDFSVPYLPVKPSVMTLHDLSPWLDGDSANPGSPMPDGSATERPNFCGSVWPPWSLLLPRLYVVPRSIAFRSPRTGW